MADQVIQKIGGGSGYTEIITEDKAQGMYVVSACLAGVACRYDGKANTCEQVIELVRRGKAIPVCPEVLGGLATPRIPCEQQRDADGQIRVVSQEGKDCTEAFEEGARKTLAIAKIVDAKMAILKAKSPSCGCGKIYDGTFSRILIDGDGLTTKYLKAKGIQIYTEEDL
ncbi:MAG: DUF523 domain-containing protein [Cellulosilyticaceae bacterium]